MEEIFEIIHGTVTGRDHRIAGKNNQDAYFIKQELGLMIVLVADGCSEGRHSEVGAKLGIRIIGQEIARLWRAASARGVVINAEGLLDTARINVLTYLRILTLALGDNFNRAVVDYLLFTVIGIIVTNEEAICFGLGDGYAEINSELIDMPCYENNEPSYLGYDLIDRKSLIRPKDASLLIFKRLPADKLQSAIIGTDGLIDLVNIAKRNLPGKDEEIGPISQFLKDKYFLNPDMLRRRLTLINRDVMRSTAGSADNMARENGLLPDDTTMIILRRKEKGDESLLK